MIKNDEIQRILNKSETEKNTIIENILQSMQKLALIFEEKKATSERLRKQAQSARDDVMNLLNGYIRRLEAENTELTMEVKELKERVMTLSETLDKTQTIAENALKEKAAAEEKLAKFQEQWERVTSG